MESENAGKILNELLKREVEDIEEVSAFKPSLVPEETIEESDDDYDDDSKYIYRVSIRDLDSLSDITKELEPEPVRADVAAVDASSITLGRTDKGILCAVRAAVVLPDKVEQFGPYIYHVTENNRESLYRYFTDLFKLQKPVVAPKMFKMPDRIRNFLERLAQIYAASRLDDGLVLWDGSLSSGKRQFDTPVELMENCLSMTIDKNSVVGVTKETTLVLGSGHSVLTILQDVSRPTIVDLTDKIMAPVKKGYKVFGKIFVAKMTNSGIPFRVDVYPSKGTTAEESMLTLIGGTEFYHGYPMPLRYAHIFSKLTRDEVIACQKYIVEKYNQLVPKLII